MRNFTSVEVTTTTPGVTITPSLFTLDGVATICVPAHPNPKAERITEDAITRITEEGEIRITEETDPNVITLTLTLTTLGGTSFDVNYIIQNP